MVFRLTSFFHNHHLFFYSCSTTKGDEKENDNNRRTNTKSKRRRSIKPIPNPSTTSKTTKTARRKNSMAHRKPFATNTKMKVDCCGYLSRITTSKVWRNWWLLKKNKANRVTIHPQTINFPKQYEGKKVRIKIEVIKE